ncbi:MAG: (2Fe-2S)-binding protein [Hyphomicrobiales bacterium]|nr:(2Fe-2S)-binding protein [Rickettsiales bacterium]MCP5361370.1 (2Fe-2S)-binding protein [Hyphomicrobiales bacterium]
MIICLCNALKEKDIKNVGAENACHSVSSLFRALDCSPCCGKCIPAMRTFCHPKTASTPAS